MEHRRLGDSDLEVSAIALGSWLTYSGGVGREQTEACTRAAFDAGITFFDTANVYGRGAAESAWGEILSGYPRDSYTLATKVYFPMGGRDRGLSRAQIHKQIDALARAPADRLRRPLPVPSLRRRHAARGDDAGADRGRGGRARRAGIGFSEWPADQIQAALDMPGVAKFVSSQPQYSTLWRGAGGRGDPAVRAQRDLADRVVAARAGRPDRQVPAARGAAGGLARARRAR